ncbi:serpin peptidase inhibitor, clade B (ovalbumin), member 4 L homeolog isoform X1 [Xenopus laevis]|uniref:Serpin peptidase inhibitor, clade B (Ovalbumin), member 4 L homeolog isoform X1 n=4 Tax=Xenopus laevis TaxID=8355 RepID=A0A8J1KVW5_XENLA|nr:serpin peptidase inhibitor, clade B (ovalbumin), member 4 L homeolog isoform X1 [Xenopus laevis]
MEPINTNINEFSLDIFKELNSSSGKTNIFLSPMSISTALSLLFLGAKENTATQMQKVLHFPKVKKEGRLQSGCATQQHSKHSEESIPGKDAPHCGKVADVHSKFQVLLSKLTKLTNGVELKIANGMFAQMNFPFLQQYLECAHALYNAKLQNVDFEKDETSQEINLWVESTTQGKIKDMIETNSLDKRTALVLVNAIYFKGEWSNPFQDSNTKDSPFYVSKDVVKSVPMMFQSQKFNLGAIKELNAQILELPYQLGALSMFILLTNEKLGLEKIEQQLSWKTLAKGMTNMEKTKVDVYLPRFMLEESYDLNSHLINMGMVDAFSEGKANLSGVSDVPLYVSKVVHKAFVEVNEKGTVAAAATGVQIEPKMLVIPRTFKANHPFVFFIKHKETDTVLFFGKYKSPYFVKQDRWAKLVSGKEDNVHLQSHREEEEVPSSPENYSEYLAVQPSIIPRRLEKFAEVLTKSTRDQWVLNAIKRGYHLEFEQVPQHSLFRWSDILDQQERREILMKYIQQLLKEGAIIPVPEEYRNIFKVISVEEENRGLSTSFRLETNKLIFENKKIQDGVTTIDNYTSGTKRLDAINRFKGCLSENTSSRSPSKILTFCDTQRTAVPIHMSAVWLSNLSASVYKGTSSIDCGAKKVWNTDLPLFGRHIVKLSKEFGRTKGFCDTISAESRLANKFCEKSTEANTGPYISRSQIFDKTSIDYVARSKEKIKEVINHLLTEAVMSAQEINSILGLLNASIPMLKWDHYNNAFYSNGRNFSLTITMSSLNNSFLEFSLDLYKELKQNPESKNIFFSPLSISSAMGMVLLGARERTAADIEKVLHFPAAVSSKYSKPACQKQTCQTEGVHVLFKELFTALNKPNEHYELNIANRTYGEKSFTFSKQYLLCLEQLYKAKLEPTDFKNNAEASIVKINAWVECKTKSKIKNLFPKGTLDDSTVLALVNAVYFKGRWKKQFEKENTKDAPFFLKTNDTTTVKMMSQTGKYKLGSHPELKCRILELPYEEGFSMKIILPDDIDGLAELEANLTYEKLTKLMNLENIREVKVVVRLPQFKFGETYSLKEVLKSMGMTSVFQGADLSGISDKVSLVISTVIHKSFIEVNEEGTEAAAATGIGIVVTSLPLPPEEFVADHPFLLTIEHNQTKSMLFFGRFTSPEI